MRPSPGKLIGWCILAFALLAASPGYCAPLAIDVRCDRAAPFAANNEDRWRRFDDGRVVLTPSQPLCWVRIARPLPAQLQLAFKTNWIDVALFDARATMLGQARLDGTDVNAWKSMDHIVIPTTARTGPLYARLSLLAGWRMPAEVVLEAADMSVLVHHDRRLDNANLATVVVLVTIGLVLLIFAVVLGHANYALLAAYLLMSAWVRLMQTGQLLTMVDAGWWTWPAWATMWPLVNALMAASATRIGRFGRHSPRLHRACLITACLFLPLCLLWPVQPSWSDDLNAVLNIPLYGLLLAGSWRGTRRADPACAILFIGSVLGAIAWMPGMLARFMPASWLGYEDLPVGGVLDVAADLIMPLLFCVALAYRQLALQRTAVAHAKHDMLTGLLNRDSILRSYDELDGAGRPHAVVMLNIDRFKAINETLGAAIGDQLLQAVGVRLAAIEGAIVGRLHADRFCLLWPGERDIALLRARLARDFSGAIAVNAQIVDLPLSVGVAHATPAREAASALLRNAEIALDAARGRHLPWLVYSSALEAGRRADLGLLAELTRAVAAGELRMHLQPKLRLSDGAMISAEALVRWQHPLRGMILPGDFVPFAVKTGRIAMLTDWMLEQAMGLTAQLRARGEPLQISVNLSARDLVRGGLAGHMVHTAARHGALPEDIRLEVTESEAMEDPVAALEAMRALRAAGFTLSIDDFGTGYSSLAYLQKMPVAELKIDRALVRHVRAGTDAALLLQSTIELGHRLGLSVVAEGPETAEEWAMLAAMGCDFAQGWHAAPAMDTAAFAQWRALHVPFVSAGPRGGADQGTSRPETAAQ